MNIETFKTVKAEAEEDVKIPDNLNALLEKRVFLPSLIQKWIDYTSKQEYIVRTLNYKFLEKQAQLEYEYKFKKPVAYDGKFLTDSVAGDASLCKLGVELEEQKFMLSFMSKTLDNLKGVGFAIRDYLDYKYGQKFGGVA